jgi:membrane protease subunit (stomatin/prohibitin family)
MGLTGQLRSVIEWKNPDPFTLFLKWTEDGDEIKNASKLIVGPGQGCVFVYEGRVRAVLETEGLVNLETDNIPFWTTIKSAVQRMQSEHKVGVFFFRRAEMVNIRWGTPAPIKYLDPVYRFAVGLGAFGNFSVRILEAEAFFKNIVAGAESYGQRDLQRLIVSRITPVITDILGKAKFSCLEIDGQRAEISAAAAEQVLPIFQTLGFQLTDFRIEATNFDEDTQARIDKIADMTAAGQAAAAAGINYQQMQQLEALKEVSKSQNGVGAAAMSLSAGLGLAQMLGSAVAPAPAVRAQSVDPSADDVEAKLQKLKRLFDAGLISEPEFIAKKKELLDKI